jgi:hypothetical protein
VCWLPMIGSVCLLSGPCLGRGLLSPFTDEAVERGVYYVSNPPASHYGAGLAFADLDDDGDADLIALGAIAPTPTVQIFENDGSGFFTAVAMDEAFAGVIKPLGVACADYDNDGDLDMVITQRGYPAQLLRNDNDFKFENRTVELPPPDAVPYNCHGPSWADVDLDGRVDLSIPRHSGAGQIPNLLLLNQPAGFVDIAAANDLQLADEPTFQTAFVDYDRDGDLDMYVATDKGTACTINGWTNHLFENVGGSFIDVSAASGTDVCLDAMCIAYGDFDNNSHVDIYCTNTATPPGNALLLNLGKGVFDNVAVAVGVESMRIGWGSVFFDVDNNGWLDLYVCNVLNENRLYYHNGTLSCADIAYGMQVDEAEDSYAVAAADVDLDGDVDLAVQVSGEPVRLYINHEGSKRHWARITVVGQGAQRDAIGAIIDVNTAGFRQRRDVVAGSNFKSQNELPQTFGLDQHRVIDAMTVAWPGGATRTFTDLPADHAWTVYPDDKLGDHDQDGAVKLNDFLNLLVCAGNLHGGCEMMDFDGDSDVDADDVDALIDRYDDPVLDCNGNKIPDLREIFLGTEDDRNHNGVIDACEATMCPWDITGSRNVPDGEVNELDFMEMFAHWGACPGLPTTCRYDIAGAGDLPDSRVGVPDLFALLQHWGSCD